MSGSELRERILAHLWWKAIGHTCVISAFFVVYFLVVQHPVFPVRTMRLFGWDYWTPVIEWTVWVYFSLWIYICLPGSLILTLSGLRQYLLGALAMATVGLGVFFFYPTAVPVWSIDWSGYPLLEFLKSADSAGNACPSLHVGYTVFAAFWMTILLRKFGSPPLWHVLNLVWGLGIILSTLTTKQHVWIDVIWGAILGLLICWSNYWWARRRSVVL